MNVSQEYRDLSRIFALWSERAATEAQRKLAEAAMERIERLEERARSSVQAARQANRQVRRMKLDSEKSYEDGYAKGLADGYYECSKILSKKGRLDG